ncbi:hypothetical protein JCM24511_04602 [Saitozyma sp. JCM 24511]|nr:hypothetical protein JCM24511_04602 [Saitozyma sp. JCM 24511]
MRRRKELALKAGEDKGLCPAGLEACSVLGTPGGYECLDTTSELADRYLPESPAADVSTNSTVKPARPNKASIQSLARALANSLSCSCQEVPGVPVGAITCQDGECEAFGCDDGYALVDGYCFEE